jgi:hypothetical protein
LKKRLSRPRSKKLFLLWAWGATATEPQLNNVLCSIRKTPVLRPDLPTECHRAQMSSGMTEGHRRRRRVTRMRAFARRVLDDIEHGGRLLAGRGAAGEARETPNLDLPMMGILYPVRWISS